MEHTADQVTAARKNLLEEDYRRASPALVHTMLALADPGEVIATLRGTSYASKRTSALWLVEKALVYCDVDDYQPSLIGNRAIEVEPTAWRIPLHQVEGIIVSKHDLYLSEGGERRTFDTYPRWRIQLAGDLSVDLPLGEDNHEATEAVAEFVKALSGRL